MNSTFPLGSVVRARYKISQLIHQSRLANVYLVEDQHLPGKVWAMKELPLVAVDPYERQRIIQRFNQDATALAQLSHPNVAKVVDYFADGNNLYIVREFVQGTSLRAYLGDRVMPLSDREASTMALQVIDALIYLQSKKFSAIFYREFHASNLIMCHDGSVKVIDLGLAQLFTAQDDEDAPSRVGSLEYAGPEQFDEAGIFDSRSLVYAVGALLYHSLTRRNPSTSPFALTPISEVNPLVSKSLQQMVHKATQNDPRSRFPTLMDLRKRLQAITKELEGRRGRGQGSSPSLSRMMMNGVLIFFFLAMIGGAMLVFYHLFPR